MAELFYPTKFKAKGPWLIDAAQLLALDDAIDTYREKSMAVRASAEGQTVTASDGTRTITFLLRHDKELQTSSFREAIVHPGAANDLVRGLKYEIRFRETIALLTLEERTEKKDSTNNKIELNIAVEPRTSVLSQEMFVVMKDWADDIPRPFWYRTVAHFKVPAVIALIFWTIIFLSGLISPSAQTAKDQYKQEARKLLQQGINTSNQQKAIELILALQSDYSPPGSTLVPKRERSLRSITINLIGMFWLIAVVLCPEFCIGIWRGKQRLRLLRYWLPITFVTIPSMLFANYLKPQLLNDFGQMLGIK